MARGLRVIALLILVLPLATPSAAAQDSPQLSAEWTADGLVVTIQSDVAWRKQVVVTLDDRVERVISLNQEAGTTKVTIPDIAARSAARVHLITSFPYVAQTSLPDVESLRSAANAVLVPAPEGPPALEARGRVTKVAQVSGAVGGDGREPKALVTASSIVVVGYVDDGALWVQSSFDGGRTFREPLNLTDKLNTTPYYVWNMAEVKPNVIDFAFRPREGNAVDWRVVRYDILQHASTGTRFFQIPPPGGAQDVALADDGRGIFARLNGSSGVDVWRVSYAAPPQLLSRLDFGDQIVEIRVDTNGDRVAVAALKGPVGGPFSPFVALSSDGGLTFGKINPLDPAGHNKGGMLEQLSIRVGDKGLAHATFTASFDANSSRTTTAYARVSADASSTRLLDESSTWSNFPALGKLGSHFWVMDQLGRSYRLRHSSNEGESFDANYSLDNGPTAFNTGSGRIAVFNDGRPLLAGSVNEADNKWWIAVMPLFDPFDTSRVRVELEAPVEVKMPDAPSGLFLDSFEQGIEASWSQVGQWSINETTTHLGAKSAYSAPGADHLAFLDRPLEAIPNTTVSAWYYDTQDACSGDETTQVLIVKSNQLGVVNLGVGIITGVSKCTYAWLEWNGNTTHTATEMPRSRGWHKFEIVSRVENATILIDGQVVAVRAPMGAPMKLIVGDPWGVGDAGLVANTGGLWDDAAYALSLGLPGVSDIIPTTPTVPIPSIVTRALETQLAIVAVAPSSVTIAPGGQGGVIITIQNQGNLAAALAAPNVTGLPAGLTLVMAEGAGIIIEPGGERSLQLALAAEAGLADQDGSIHWQMQSLTLDVPIRVSLARVELEPSAPLPALPVAVQVAAGLGAAAAGVALVARSEPGKMLSGSLLIPLYSRLKRSDILKHDVRAGVHAHIAKHPGIRYEELRRALELPNGVLAFHLRILQREGFVATRAAWTRRTYYATGAAMPPAPAARGEVLVALLSKHPGLTPSEVASRLSMSRQLAHYHLRALERQGTIRSRSAAGTRVYESVALSPEGQS